MSDIKKVVVLGAGTMGTGIAGVAANAGCDVLLLDMEKEACEQARQRLVAGRSPVVAEASVLSVSRPAPLTRTWLELPTTTGSAKSWSRTWKSSGA